MMKTWYEQGCLSVESKNRKCVWRSPVPGALLSQLTVLELRLRVSGVSESFGFPPESHGVWRGPWFVHWKEMHNGWGRFFRQIPGEQFQVQIPQKWLRYQGQMAGECHPMRASRTVGSVQGLPGEAQKGVTGNEKMWFVGSQLSSLGRGRGVDKSCRGVAWLWMCLYVCLPVWTVCVHVWHEKGLYVCLFLLPFY